MAKACITFGMDSASEAWRHLGAVLAKSGSRFGRDAREAFAVLQVLLNPGVLLLFFAQQFDPDYANNIPSTFSRD